MGILCQCKQPIIYVKEKTVIELDDGSQHPKKEYTNKSTTLKSKNFTKDTTLINHSNDNSPNKDELYNKILKNNLTELEISNNLKDKTRHDEKIKKNKTDVNHIKPKVSFFCTTPSKIQKKTYTNNIHVKNKDTNLLNRNSLPVNTCIMNKLVLPGNIINSKNAEFYELQRANSFNLEKRLNK